jgi:hypothetical protein
MLKHADVNYGSALNFSYRRLRHRAVFLTGREVNRNCAQAGGLSVMVHDELEFVHPEELQKSGKTRQP